MSHDVEEFNTLDGWDEGTKAAGTCIRGDAFGRKGVISFVDADVVGTFIEPARPPPRIWRRRGGMHYATSKAFGIGETRDDADGVHVILGWIC